MVVDCSELNNILFILTVENYTRIFNNKPSWPQVSCAVQKVAKQIRGSKSDCQQVAFRLSPEAQSRPNADYHA